MAAWDYTDDPADPCGLCVQWRGPDGAEIDMENVDRAEPYWPDGSVVARVFRDVHPRCSAVVAHMQDLADREGAHR